MRRWQLKEFLKGVWPPVWRELLVPDSISLEEVCAVARLAIGWSSDRECSVNAGNAWFARPDPDDDEWPLSLEFTTLGDLVEASSPRFTVHDRYSPADAEGWDIEIVLEGPAHADGPGNVVRCCSGARAGPPRECKGPPGYAKLLKGLDSPEGANVGEGRFDPEAFELTAVNEVLSTFKLARPPIHPGRNDRCPCGSGKKYKSCCIEVDRKWTEERPVHASRALEVARPSKVIAASVRERWHRFGKGPADSTVGSKEPCEPELLMHAGYVLWDEGKGEAATDAWWRLWTRLRDRIIEKHRVRWDADELVAGEASFRTWTGDFLERVEHVARTSARHAELGVVYARELAARFPREDPAFHVLTRHRLGLLLLHAGRSDEASLALRDLLVAKLADDYGILGTSLPDAWRAIAAFVDKLFDLGQSDPWFLERVKQGEIASPEDLFEKIPNQLEDALHDLERALEPFEPGG